MPDLPLTNQDLADELDAIQALVETAMLPLGRHSSAPVTEQQLYAVLKALRDGILERAIEVRHRGV